MNKKTRIGDGAPGQRRPGYTGRDMEYFEKLMDFNDLGAAVAGSAGSGEAPRLPPVLKYADGDVHQFEKLMTFHQGARRSQSQSKRRAGPVVGYTDNDNRLFDELMSFEQKTAAAYAVPVLPQEPIPAAVGYTPKDLEAFRRLMPEQRQADDVFPDDPQPGRSGGDADVGHIRIVDFDQENSRRKGARRDMKIRFFD